VDVLPRTDAVHRDLDRRYRRFFDDGGPFTSLSLIDSTTTGTGVIIATYRPVNRSSS
jgi:hypothetical protein